MPSTQYREQQIHQKDIAQSNDSLNIIMNHLNSFQKNDLDALLFDYTNKSILVTQEKTYIGFDEIALFFASFITHFPPQKSSFELDKIIVENELGYIVWHCQTPTFEILMGSDTFIIKDNKIYQQTFVAKMK